jgi:general L-amino acid transport system permease protein
MTRFCRTALLEPRDPPRARSTPATQWARALFAGPATALVSLVIMFALGAATVGFLKWAIVNAQWTGASAAACPRDNGACWAFVIARWKPWLVGDYPADQLWRPFLCFGVFALFWVWVIYRPRNASMRAVLGGFVGLPIVFAALLLGGIGGLPFVPPSRLGGLLLTLLVTLCTFATALPAGLMLALGRRSSLQVVRGLCAGFVESVRAVPLLAVLFIAATLLPMLLPPGNRIDLFTRALVAFALFNAAMAAEVFRGGLQAISRGQVEAATTIGLGDFVALRLVVLPQAVTLVVPALVNIMIAIIKETTVLLVIGVNDLLGAVHGGAKSPDWIGGPNILTSGHVFLALVYLGACYGLSRYSRRLESQR